MSIPEALSIGGIMPVARPTPLVLRAAALRDGYSDAEIRRFLRAGTLISVRPGAYATGGDALGPGGLERLRVVATAQRLTAPSVVSHQSAAALHLLPLWSLPAGPVHVTRLPPSRGRREHHLHVHVAGIPEGDVRQLAGVNVTGGARTVMDLARTLPFEQAVIAGDDALHRGLASRADLDRIAADMRNWHGMRAAKRVLRFLDGRTESVGESRTRVAIHRAGLPSPEPQVSIFDRRKEFVGRVDLGYRAERVAVEFDGRIKYGRGLTGNRDPSDVVFEEKLREDALRDLGWQVVRLVWADLANPAEFLARLARRLDGATPEHL